jgi:amino acid adenylation domain-containing protein
MNILNYFELTVQNLPKKKAVIEGEKSISFEKLHSKAKVLANLLISKKDINNEPVAVFLPKTIESIISDIAITYSCNIYMNLDIKTPKERIKNIVELVNPKFIITNSLYFNFVSDIVDNEIIINIDTINFDFSVDNECLIGRLEKSIDTDPLCIINTSGSTGTPKAVVLNHRSYIDYTQWAINRFNFDGSEILGVLSPIIFDHFNFEICLMMTKGSALVLLDNNMATYPAKLLNSLIDHKVNFIFWVPTIMVNIANMNLLEHIHLPLIKMIWFAGEVFPTKQFNYWKRWIPNATYVNLYGPIETTVDCTYFVVNREIKDEEPLPIGTPCRNTDILILNDNNLEVKGQEKGELCVRGTSLAMGYYNNPEKTKAAFVQNPLNSSYPERIYRTGDIVSRNELGEIVFKGRKDSLVKHLGYRIELGEIEHVIINTLKLAKNGCIVYNSLKKEITLFYEAEEDIKLAVFRKQITTVLPKYMVPTVYIRMDELPRNANGKINRLELKNNINLL